MDYYMYYEDKNVHIYLARHKELLDPNLKVKDAKKILKGITGISEENILFKVYLNFSIYSPQERLFWNPAIIYFYDASSYKTKLT